MPFFFAVCGDLVDSRLIAVGLTGSSLSFLLTLNKFPLLLI